MWFIFPYIDCTCILQLVGGFEIKCLSFLSNNRHIGADRKDLHLRVSYKACHNICFETARSEDWGVNEKSKQGLPVALARRGAQRA